MKIEFHKKTFVLLGRFKLIDKRAAEKKISELGGYNSSTPRPSSDYIVVGDRPGKKVDLIEKVGKPRLTEEEFIAAIAAAESGREAGQEDIGSSESVAGLRGFVYDAPSPEVWKEIQALLDQCAPDQLDVAADYAEHHVSNWSDASAQLGAPFPMSFDGPPRELRVFSAAWRKMILAGERSPKLRLGRRLDLAKMDLRGDQADHIPNHPDLVNLTELNIGLGNMLDPAFYEGLRRSKHLPRLSSLMINHISFDSALALCGEHTLTNLRRVSLSPNSMQRGWSDKADEAYDHLFAADWWPQIEGLHCGLSGSYSPYYRNRPTVYPQLARHAARMTGLKHLALEDGRDIDALFETDLFQRISQLSLSCNDPSIHTKVLEHLDAHRGDHALEVLDLSRSVFVGVWGRPKKYAKPLQVESVNRLMASESWGPLREVTIVPGFFGVKLRKKLEAWAAKAGITITEAPWS